MKGATRSYAGGQSTSKRTFTVTTLTGSQAAVRSAAACESGPMRGWASFLHTRAVIQRNVPGGSVDNLVCTVEQLLWNLDPCRLCDVCIDD
jgi:hypothetical protein